MYFDVFFLQIFLLPFFNYIYFELFFYYIKKLISCCVKVKQHLLCFIYVVSVYVLYFVANELFIMYLVFFFGDFFSWFLVSCACFMLRLPFYVTYKCHTNFHIFGEHIIIICNYYCLFLVSLIKLPLIIYYNKPELHYSIHHCRCLCRYTCL